eukprot:7381615-Prymnesium_polylepis.1
MAGTSLDSPVSICWRMQSRVAPDRATTALVPVSRWEGHVSSRSSQVDVQSVVSSLETRKHLLSLRAGTSQDKGVSRWTSTRPSRVGPVVSS